MFISKKNHLLILLLILSFFYTSAFSSTNIKIIFASSMFDISQNKHGSYSKLATLLKKERSKNPNTIFLFGGDSLGPSSMSSLDKGVHIIDILNSLEPDAVAVNRRELMFGPDELTLRSFEAAFPFVASNIYDQLTKGNIDGIRDNIIIKKANIKIGIISVLNPAVIEEYGLKRLTILDLEKSIRIKAQRLRNQNVNFIILLPAIIFSETQRLLDEGIIDLSLDKNVHFELEEAQRHEDIKNILITRRDTVTKIVIEFDNQNNKVLSTKNKLLKLNDYQEDKEVLQQINSYKKRIDSLFKEKIGVFLNQVNTKREVIRRKESIFGNLLADSIRDYTGAQIALINGGIIRGEMLYPKNHSIMRKDIIKEVPFRNNVELIEGTGEQITKALENGLSLLEKSKGRFLHLSGMKIVFNPNNPVGKRIKSVTINGNKLNKKQLYTLATSDYIASGGDGYTMFLNSKKIKYFNPKQRLISSVLIDYIIKNRSISTKIEGRIKEVYHGK